MKGKQFLNYKILIKYFYFYLFLIGYNNINHKPITKKEEAIDLILDAFHSCAERDIYTGD